MPSARSAASPCPICRAPRELAFHATVLDKYDAAYLSCLGCGLLQAESPHWLAEAHERAIAPADTGLVARNLQCARTLSTLLYFLVGRRGRYLDVGGGLGLLTRLMRDCGFDFYWADEHAQNIFAPGFELGDTGGPFAACTAIETLEHVHDPLEFVRGWFSRARTRTMIFTTQLFEGPPPPREWWYYGFRSGQHVSFYQERTLRALADALGVGFTSNGHWHMLTDRPVSQLGFRLLAGPCAGPFSAYVGWRLESKTLRDSEHVLHNVKSR